MSRASSASDDGQTGPKPFSIYKRAGLPAPNILIEGLAGGAARSVPFLVADVVKALVPVMEANGIITAEESDVVTLEERMRRELDRKEGIVLVPPFFGVWTRHPTD